MLFDSLKGLCTGISAVDSTPLAVCDNLRISRHKMFDEYTERGKSSTGWFFGFKLHAIINHLGKIISVRLTAGNVDDKKPVPDIAGKSIYGASLNIVYKDSITPNNRLTYQITKGTTQLPAETITTRNADITGYTTLSKILTKPANGRDWDEENLRVKLNLVNNRAE